LTDNFSVDSCAITQYIMEDKINPILDKGYELLNRKDFHSIELALHKFKKANELTDNDDRLKPMTLYALAFGNLAIHNNEKAYLIAQKAKQTIPLAKNSFQFIDMSNAPWPGEDKINGLIEFLESKEPYLKSIDKTKLNDINENDLDFTLLRKRQQHEENNKERTTKDDSRKAIANKQKAVELCELGIAEKRKSNFEQALNYYNKAKQVDPTFPHTYKNSAKVLIGLEQYELAFRHLLTVSHLNMIIPQYDIQQFESILNYYYSIDETHSYLNQDYFSFFEQIYSEQPILKYIAIDINITRLAGICYIMKHKEIIEHHGIDLSLIKNDQKILLGQIPTGQSIGGTEYEKLFNLIGFIYIALNINGGEFDLLTIPNIYFDENYKFKEIEIYG